MLRQTSNKGATMVECAIVLPFFLFFLLCSFDIFMFYYQKLSLQHVFWKSVRQCQASNKCLNAEQTMLQVNQQLDTGFQLGPSDQIMVCNIDQFTSTNGCTAFSKGSAGDVVIYRLTKTANLFLTGLFPKLIANGNIYITVTAIVKNEPA